MSGHSHWAGIKRKKGVADAKRSAQFSKVARIIMTAAREGGGDPDANAKLKNAVDKARQVNMPKDNIERAIKKGTGELPGVSFEEATYEGYGPGGVAVLVEVLTDNRNRTTSELRKLFETRGGNMGSSGCVAWMFEKKGLITIDTSAIGEDELLDLALDAGADDMKAAGSFYEITTSVTDFAQVKASLEQKNLPFQIAEITSLPKQTASVEGDVARRVLALLEELEDHEDVQNVYANFDISDELFQDLANN